MTVTEFTSKKYKTIKHIVLCWGDRELLRFPYPIFLFDRQAVSFDGYGGEVTFALKDTFFWIYFNETPMVLTRKLEKKTWYCYDWGDAIRYIDYFPLDHSKLGMADFSFFLYKTYSEMFVQSQQIMKNMELDSENFFEGVEDIKIDISESPYKEEFKQMLVFCYSEEPRFRSHFPPLSGLTLESSKRVILDNFGEESVYGYVGLNAEALNQYSSIRELLIFIYLQERFLKKLPDVVPKRTFVETEVYKYFMVGSYGIYFYHIESYYSTKLFRKLKLLIK